MRQIKPSTHTSIRVFAAMMTGIFVLASQTAHASPAAELLHVGYAHEALYGLAFEGSEGIAVGSPELVLVTADRGQSWTPERLENGGLALLGVAMADHRAIAVGQMGKIFLRDRSAWREVASGTTERLLAVDMTASGLAVAVGGFGTILKSTDHGVSWTSVAPDWQPILQDILEPHINAVKIGPSGTITVAGEFGLILRSSDGGQSWQVLHRGSETLFGLYQDSKGLSAAVGQNGVLLVSEDWQRPWHAVATGRTENLLDIWIDPNGRMVITGVRTLLVSRDGGGHWEAVDREDVATGWYEGITAASESAPALAVGNEARILKVGE